MSDWRNREVAGAELARDVTCFGISKVRNVFLTVGVKSEDSNAMISLLNLGAGGKEMFNSAPTENRADPRRDNQRVSRDEG
jgi:hypothetical protein